MSDEVPPPSETGTLYFNLDDPFGRIAMQRAMKALDMALALQAILDWFRQEGDREIEATFSEVEDRIRDIVRDHVDLNDVLR